MNSSLSVIIQNAKEEIVETINKQKINPCIMQYVIKEVYDVVREAAKTELERDINSQKVEVVEDGNTEL